MSLTRAVAQAVYELSLADGLRDVRNVQADLLEALGLAEDVMVGLDSPQEVATVLHALNIDWTEPS